MRLFQVAGFDVNDIRSALSRKSSNTEDVDLIIRRVTKKENERNRNGNVGTDTGVDDSGVNMECDE